MTRKFLASRSPSGYNPFVMQNEPAYQASLDYLYSFVDFSLTRGFLFAPEKFNLGRMFDLMAVLGNPHQAYPLIHIAGTKGKGSVSAMCASVLQEAGYRVGFYSSPHLHDYTERIQVDQHPIAHMELVELVEEIKPFVAQIPALTTFEITTALAFLYFARQGVNAAVIEVGLGGRLDATNIVNPLVSVITSLSYDHMNILGSTLSEIAREKAGIIKPGVPVVLAPQKEEARLVIEGLAFERGSLLIQVGDDILYQPLTHSIEEGQVFQVGLPSDTEPMRLELPLLGSHQVDNAAVAYTALQTAQSRGLSISVSDIKEGFRKVRWPGRFEILCRNPYLVVDSAHNRDSAQKLLQALEDYFPGKPVVMIFGASEDKDIDGMFAELLPRVCQLVATRSFHPRAIEPEKLLEIAQPYHIPIWNVEKVEDALDEAIRLAGEDALVLAAGSLFIAAAVRETWLSR